MILVFNLHASLYGPFSITFGKTGCCSCVFSAVGTVVPDIPHMASTWKVDMVLLLHVKEVIQASMYISAGLVLLPILSSRIVLTIASSWDSFTSFGVNAGFL